MLGIQAALITNEKLNLPRETRIILVVDFIPTFPFARLDSDLPNVCAAGNEIPHDTNQLIVGFSRFSLPFRLLRINRHHLLVDISMTHTALDSCCLLNGFCKPLQQQY